MTKHEEETLEKIRNGFRAMSLADDNSENETEIWKTCVNEIEAFLSTVQPEEEWRDISTAPKDGTHFIAGYFFLNPDPIFDQAVICWDDDCEFFTDGGYDDSLDEYISFPATHWQPLTQAPETSKE